jgi:hypothetical protein
MKILQITENISHTSKRIHDIEKEKGVKPGTPEWFKLWFSLPYLKESITEALNNPYSYYWDETYNDDSSFLAKAEMDMGELMVMFSVGEPGVSWTIDFAVDGSMHKTGDGDQFRIFATVVAVIKDWAANKVDLSKVTQIDFSSDKDGVGEDSRSKLYKRFGQQLASKLGWNLEITDRGQFASFKIKNPNAPVKEAVNEGYRLQLERDADMMVLNITDTATGKRTEVRGKPGYETDGYDPKDKLHHLLDKIGRSASVSDMMNGDVVTINPKHPTGASAKAATDTAFNEDVNIDNKEGWGAVSNNQEVDYFGMRVKMKPSVFLKLAESRRGVPAADKVIDHIKNGGAIGAPFLIISYTQGSPAEIIGHEGRSRMIAIQQVFGDIPVEVHLFFNSDTVNRARHLTPDIVADINKTMMSQDDQELSGPFFTESINEKITKRTPMGDVIDDFYQSDAPQFKGKSKAKRRQMAIAAKLSKMDENFADGKKKGKSRPGRVKRAGASCDGSVTDLRARAKKYSGERAKMYHWCANMKAGKKK